MTLYDLGFLILIIGIYLFYNRYIRYKKNKHLKDISAMGKKEQELLEILKEKKYKIQQVSPEVSLHLEEDFKTYLEHYKYPLIVRKNKKDYLVKIKKDKETIRFSSSLYRKSLITECAIFGVQGIIIIDGAGRIREFNIDIPIKTVGRPKMIMFTFTAFIVGAYISFKFF